MSQEEFNRLVEEMIEEVRARLCKKGREYSPDYDRLSNFRVAAELQGTIPETALMGMAAKHTVSLFDMCRDDGRGYTDEQWKEKIGDDIAYRLILYAMVMGNE